MRIKFYTVSILVLFLCVNFACAQEFYQPKKSYAEERDSYVKTFDKFSPSEIQTPFTSGFSGQIPLNKQDLTPKEKANIRLAKEEMKSKKLQFSSEEFIKQIKKNKLENVDLMLKAGISPNSDFFGEYAIFYAVKYNKTEIANLLLEKGANPNAGFNSPLFWAVKNKNEDLVKSLVSKGAKLDYTDIVSSKSIIYTALEKNNLDIAKLLLDNGAKIDSKSALLIEKKNLYSKLGLYR